MNKLELNNVDITVDNNTLYIYHGDKMVSIRLTREDYDELMSLDEE